MLLTKVERERLPAAGSECEVLGSTAGHTAAHTASTHSSASEKGLKIKIFEVGCNKLYYYQSGLKLYRRFVYQPADQISKCPVLLLDSEWSQRVKIVY